MTSALEFDEKRFWIALFSIVTRREARMQETEEDFRSESGIQESDACSCTCHSTEVRRDGVSGKRRMGGMLQLW